MPITAKVVNSKPAQARCTRYNIMRFSLSVACDRPVVFSGYTPVSSNKTDLHAITEILLKVALIAITVTLTHIVVTKRMSLVEQKRMTLPEYLISPLGFSGVRVDWLIVWCFVDHCLSFSPSSFGHYNVYPSSIYGF